MDYSKIDFKLSVYLPEPPMEKTIHTSAYALFLDLLRAQREGQGLTQLAIAAKMRTTQTFVSKCERGERRLDVVELYLWCNALGISMTAFVQSFDDALQTSIDESKQSTLRG